MPEMDTAQDITPRRATESRALSLHGTERASTASLNRYAGALGHVRLMAEPRPGRL
jgi:hypothetical protein